MSDIGLINKILKTMVFSLLLFTSIFCSQKPEIIIHEAKLYEFLFYSGYYSKDDLVISFSQQKNRTYSLNGSPVTKVTVGDILKKKINENVKSLSSFEYFEAEIIELNEKNDIIQKFTFGKNGKYQIKIYPTRVVPFEFSYKGVNTYLLEKEENFVFLNYGIFRGNELFDRFRMNLHKNKTLQNVIAESVHEQIKMNKNITEKDLFSKNDYAEKLFIALDTVLSNTVKEMKYQPAVLKPEYEINYADEMIKSQKTGICLDNSLFISTVLNSIFDYAPVLFYLKTKNEFHVLTGVTRADLYKPEAEAEIYLIESNQGQAKRTQDLLQETDLGRLFKVEYNSLKDCQNSQNQWKSACQFVGKISMKLPRSGFIRNNNSEKTGIITFHKLFDYKYNNSPSEGHSSQESYDAVINFRKAHIQLSSESPTDYYRDDIFVVEKMFHALDIKYSTARDCVSPIVFSKKNMEVNTNVSKLENCLGDIKLIPEKDTEPPHIYHWKIKSKGEQNAKAVLTDQHGIKAGKNIMKNVELIVNIDSNYSFSNFAGCLFLKGFDSVNTDKKELFQKCLANLCRPEFNCLNLSTIEINKNSSVIHLSHKMLEPDQYLWVVYELKKGK